MFTNARHPQNEKNIYIRLEGKNVHEWINICGISVYGHRNKLQTCQGKDFSPSETTCRHRLDTDPAPLSKNKPIRRLLFVARCSRLAFGSTRISMRPISVLASAF